MTTKKCTKQHDARAKLLFCLTNLLLFDDLVAVAVAVAVVVAKAPKLNGKDLKQKSGRLL